MERLKGGMFITPKDIQIIHGWQNLRTAQQEHQSVRDALGLMPHMLTVKQYCTFKELDLEEVISYINPFRN